MKSLTPADGSISPNRRIGWLVCSSNPRNDAARRKKRIPVESQRFKKLTKPCKNNFPVDSRGARAAFAA